jgi:ATP-dependent exoDNAse (exonuclease V) alpha subunit
VTLDDGRSVDIPAAYARAGHLDHGYALTAHLAQGATVERAFVLGRGARARSPALVRARQAGRASAPHR